MTSRPPDSLPRPTANRQPLTPVMGRVERPAQPRLTGPVSPTPACLSAVPIRQPLTANTCCGGHDQSSPYRRGARR